MTPEQLKKVVQEELDWLIDKRYRDVLRRDISIHIAERIYQELARESGEEAEHHEAGRFWNASSGDYDSGGCW